MVTCASDSWESTVSLRKWPSAGRSGRQLTVALAVVCSAIGCSGDAPRATFHGFEMAQIRISDFSARLVTPVSAAPMRPWVWRSGFFGVAPQLDIELLRRGFHLISIDTEGLCGGSEALRRFHATYDHAVGTLAMSPRPVIEALSRGALPAFRWASAHPQSVSLLIGDGPVLDFRSWPGGFGRADRSEAEWSECLHAHGLPPDADARNIVMPVDELAALARNDVPVLLVIGELDDVVPPGENAMVFADRYRLLGGSVRLEIKPEAGHHPHGFPDLGPVLELVDQQLLGRDRPF